MINSSGQFHGEHRRLNYIHEMPTCWSDVAYTLKRSFGNRPWETLLSSARVAKRNEILIRIKHESTRASNFLRQTITARHQRNFDEKRRRVSTRRKNRTRGLKPVILSEARPITQSAYLSMCLSLCVLLLARILYTRARSRAQTCMCIGYTRTCTYANIYTHDVCHISE